MGRISVITKMKPLILLYLYLRKVRGKDYRSRKRPMLLQLLVVVLLLMTLGNNKTKIKRREQLTHLVIWQLVNLPRLM